MQGNATLMVRLEWSALILLGRGMIFKDREKASKRLSFSRISFSPFWPPAYLPPFLPFLTQDALLATDEIITYNRYYAFKNKEAAYVILFPISVAEHK